MNRWAYYLIGVAALTSWLGLVTGAGAETCTLKSVQVGVATGTIVSGLPSDYRFRGRSQSFLSVAGGQLISGLQSDTKPKPDFSAVITKEPERYEAETPFRNVAELGGKYYGFALDTAPRKAADTEKEAEKKDSEQSEKKEAEEAGAGLLDVLAGGPAVSPGEKPAKPLALTRLYFDLNHNGDLTDDGVIEADPAKTVEMARGTARSQARSVFPTITVSLDIGGRKVEFPFTMSTNSQTSGTMSYVGVQLSAAAYREGEITLEGEKRRVVLVDYNSNGRFDDASVVAPRSTSADGPVYPQVGDMLFIDPQTPRLPYAPLVATASKDQFPVSPLIMYRDRLFDLKIDPSGETLSLEPSSIATGYVTNPNRGFRATVYGERGIVEIVDDGSGKAALPEGEWKLLAYTITAPKPIEEEPKTEEKEGEPATEESEGRSVLDLLGSPAAPARPAVPRPTTVSAQGTSQSRPVKVTGGQTVEFQFGPPYTPQVTAAMREGQPNAALSLKLIGTAGEVCSSLVVNGARPGQPEFTIFTKDDKEVEKGKFSYG